jgi:hypothetical protein
MKRTLEKLLPAGLLSAVLVLGTAAFATAASSPSVTTGSHSHVTDTSAKLLGTINPNGNATAYYFEWGLTTAYGVTSVEHSAGRGTKPVAVSTTASALIPGTVYHYRLVAANASGSATGSVSPNKQATTYYFQYGPSTSYGSQTIAATVPAGTAPVTVTASVQGLEAQTIFHYRIVALHGNTVPQPGTDATFMTLPIHRPVPHIHARTTPPRDRTNPYVFTTTGSVHGPSWIPAIYDCRGNVAIRYFRGSRRIGSTLVPLGPDCKFSGQTVFTRIPGGHSPVAITVIAHYLGNFYLTPHKTPGQTITFG